MHQWHCRDNVPLIDNNFVIWGSKKTNNVEKCLRSLIFIEIAMTCVASWRRRVGITTSIGALVRIVNKMFKGKKTSFQIAIKINRNHFQEGDTLKVLLKPSYKLLKYHTKQL